MEHISTVETRTTGVGDRVMAHRHFEVDPEVCLSRVQQTHMRASLHGKL